MAENITENPHAPDVFADACSGIFLLNGVVHMTFVSARPDYSGPNKPVSWMTIGRLVMPLVAAENLRDFLADQIAKFKAGTPPEVLPPKMLN